MRSKPALSELGQSVLAEFQAFIVKPKDAGVNLAPMLVGLLGPQTVAKALKSHAARLPVINHAARLAGIARARHRLAALGHAEEALIVQRTRDGDRVSRRPDADPAIVLHAA